MLKQLKQRREGFTIIEVLIVLAIAGLIMVVVFMAVPNLRRNQANNDIRTQANNLLAAYGEVSSNKGGKTLTSTDAATVKSAANVDAGSTVAIKSGTTSQSSDYGTTTFTFFTSAQCTEQDSATLASPTSSRKVALLFAVETAGGTQVQCLTN